MEHELNVKKLSNYTNEFVSKQMEEKFLRFTWNDNKNVTRNALLVIGFIGGAFFIRDILEVNSRDTLFSLLFLRLAGVAVILASAAHIHYSSHYFNRYHYLLVINQIIISFAIYLLAVMRGMPIANLGVNTILFTLIFYQFMNNKFFFTLFACFFIGLGAIVTSLIYLNMNLSDFIATILFLTPLNFLGITILRSVNRSRRNEYMALIEMRKSNEEKERLIQDLQGALAEVKTLRGFLPICSNCKKIRDDAGYWNQLESYLKANSEVEFSHSICPDCAKELYGDQDWFEKMYEDDQDSSG